MTIGSGAAAVTSGSRQRRSGHSRSRALTGIAAFAAAAALLGGCTDPAPDPTPGAGVSDGGGAAPGDPTADPAAEAALETACTEFYGDPDYTAPLSRVVLDRAATAPDVGPSDPFFYTMTGDDIDAVFADAPEDLGQAATALAEWFRTEPEHGQDADRDGFRDAWEGLAAACQGASTAATWIIEPGEDGTKPAPLVCSRIYDTPSTLVHFANANVLTSNMFRLVGLGGRSVPAERMDDVQATEDLLARESAAVDDEAVRAGIDAVRVPFQDALQGDMWSDGIQQPLDQLAAACRDVGYDVPAVVEDEDNSAVVGAPRPGDQQDQETA